MRVGIIDAGDRAAVETPRLDGGDLGGQRYSTGDGRSGDQNSAKSLIPLSRLRSTIRPVP